MKNATGKEHQTADRNAISHIVIVCLFIIFIFTGTLLHLILPDRTFSDSEKRVLEQFPQLNGKTLIDGSFMSRFETYVNDQFPGREIFVGLKTETERLLGKKDNGRVWFGDDGFLFELKTETVDLSFHAGELALFASYMDKASPETDRYLLIAPTATTFEADALPAYAQVVDQQKHLKQLQEDAGDYTFISLDEAFSTSSDHLFYRNDHHWTSAGARTAFEAFARAAGLDDTDIPNKRSIVLDNFLGSTYAKANTFFPVADTIEKYVPENGSDLNDLVKVSDGKSLIRTGIYDDASLESFDPYLYFLGENRDYLKLETNSKGGRTLLLIKDSYANSVIPFLTSVYSEIHIIDLRYFSRDMYKFIEEEGPFTDTLFLYNFVTFSGDNNLYRLNP
jgi:hypothetical protein